MAATRFTWPHLGAALLTGMIAGCAIVGAASRAQNVKKLQLGMKASEVVEIVGEPQGKKTLTASEGQAEVWNYWIYEGGYWKDFSIGFKEARLASLQAPAVEPTADAPTPAERLGVEDSLRQIYFAAFAEGYRQAERDRDAAWSEAVARLFPEDQRATKQREAEAFVADRKVGEGEERAAREMHKAWDDYLAAEKERLHDRFGL